MTRFVFAYALLLAALAPTLATAQTPAVVLFTPADSAVDVPARETPRLTITFDRDMDRDRHSLCGGAGLPLLSGPRWASARTFHIDAVLEPDRVYAVELACPGSHGFRAAGGAGLRPTPWRFATEGPALSDADRSTAERRLLQAIADHYSHRDLLGIDWPALVRMHHYRRHEAPSPGAFALAVANVLTTAHDAHITVVYRGTTLATHRRDVQPNYDGRSVFAVLPNLTPVGRTALRARSDDGIGYLFVGSFAREHAEDIELILQTLRSFRDCKGIVLDVRTNAGGDEDLARRVAAPFVAGERVYAQHRVRDAAAEHGFQPVQQRRIRGASPVDRFHGPVAVLMGPYNMSSCEAFLLMMKQAENAFLVGEKSYGSSGNPQPHELLPGLTVLLPSWQAQTPDGKALEGQGVSPHLHVATTAADLATSDRVLDEALLRLRGLR
jgi:hypothetical protein